MHSITIISGTNRNDSNTQKVSNYYLTALKAKNIEAEVFSLKNLPESFLHSDLFGQRSHEFQLIIEKYIEHQTKFIFVAPEYNGSFAGILKVFIDSIPPKYWAENKA